MSCSSEHTGAGHRLGRQLAAGREQLVVSGKDFGQDKGLFETFFKEYGKSVDQISSKYEKGRNILYVAVTRAIKNLRILYIDDLEEIRDSMEKVFGKIYEFSNGITKEEF